MRPNRRLPPDLDPIDYLLSLPADLRIRAIEKLDPEEREALDRAWPEWAHPGQEPPEVAWSTWVLKAGRGFGKTFAGAQWITALVAGGEPLKIALVGATLDDTRRVMVEGRSGLLEVAGAWVTEWHPSTRTLRFRTGAEAVLFSGSSPAMLRGPEHHYAWCDELAKWDKPKESWEMLQLGLRLGAHPQALITTTPRPGPVLRAIMDEPETTTTHGRTRANPHTSRSYKRRVEALYAGTRLGRQELEGEILTDAPGALWWPELITRCRAAAGAAAGFTRALIAVDPPSGGGTCGIIACALDADGIGHVLADHSRSGVSPEEWAQAVAGAAAAHGTREVVAEANQGGRMVKTVLRTADKGLRVTLATATRSKSYRAEPVSHLFQAGRVVIHGEWKALEDQLIGMIGGGGYDGPGTSPDRADAMVWGLSALMLDGRGEPRVRML